MGRDMSVHEAQALLRTRVELLDRDVPAGRLRSASSSEWRRVQRGVYVARDAVDHLWPQADLRLRIVAATSRMRGGDAVVSHVSAAVVHGLALVGVRRGGAQGIAARASVGSRSEARRLPSSAAIPSVERDGEGLEADGHRRGGARDDG